MLARMSRLSIGLAVLAMLACVPQQQYVISLQEGTQAGVDAGAGDDWTSGQVGQQLQNGGAQAGNSQQQGGGGQVGNSQPASSLRLTSAEEAQADAAAESFLGLTQLPSSGTCYFDVLQCPLQQQATGTKFNRPSSATGCRKAASFYSQKCGAVGSVSGNFAKTAGAPDEPNGMVQGGVGSNIGGGGGGAAGGIRPMQSCTAIDANGLQNEVNNIGAPTKVIFWATWCGPCRQKLPTLDPSKVVLVAIFSKQADVDPTLAQVTGGKKFQCYFESDPGRTIAQKYNVTGVPDEATVSPTGAGAVGGSSNAGSSSNPGLCQISFQQCPRYPSAQGRMIERDSTQAGCSVIASAYGNACGNMSGTVGNFRPRS